MESVIIERQFAEIVKAELTENNISIRELGRRTGIDPSEISRYLNGKQPPGPATMEKILSALGLVPALSVTRQ